MHSSPAGRPITTGSGGGGGGAPAAAAPAAWAGASPQGGTPYTDPGKQFTITYPAGWHVRRQGGATSFYLNDPDEGTSLLIIPRFRMKGELDAAQVFETLARTTRKRYPDFKVVGHEQRTLPAKPGGGGSEGASGGGGCPGPAPGARGRAYGLS